MPKVKLLTSMAGIDFSHNSGDVIDCNKAEALRFISAGIAEPVEEEKIERATKKRFVRTAIETPEVSSEDE